MRDSCVQSFFCLGVLLARGSYVPCFYVRVSFEHGNNIPCLMSYSRVMVSLPISHNEGTFSVVLYMFTPLEKPFIFCKRAFLLNFS